METTRINEVGSVSPSASVEVGKTGRIRKLTMAVSLAVMATVGVGCSDKPDSINVCLGNSQASVHKSRLKTMRKTCKERHKDYNSNKDSEMTDKIEYLRDNDCQAYVDEIKVTRGLLQAKEDSARLQRNWNVKDACSDAIENLDNMPTTF